MNQSSRTDADDERPVELAGRAPLIHERRGKYYDELVIGDIYRHRPGRTVTEADNLLITALSLNSQSLHLDEHYSRTTEWGQRLVNSVFTLAYAIGVGVGELTEGTTVGNLGFESMSFPKPVFIGDTLYAETEVAAVRPSRSRPGEGVVTFEHRAHNQRGEEVFRARRVALMRRSPQGINDATN